MQLNLINKRAVYIRYQFFFLLVVSLYTKEDKRNVLVSQYFFLTTSGYFFGNNIKEFFIFITFLVQNKFFYSHFQKCNNKILVKNFSEELKQVLSLAIEITLRKL